MMRESMFEFRRKVFPVGAFSAALLLTGCLFQDVRSQQSKMETFCRISGSVTTEQDHARPNLVGLVRHTGGALEERENWHLVDHFVMESPGRWMFRAGPATYGLVAFEDSNADGIYQPGEPFLAINQRQLVICETNRDSGSRGCRSAVDARDARPTTDRRRGSNIAYSTACRREPAA